MVIGTHEPPFTSGEKCCLGFSIAFGIALGFAVVVLKIVLKMEHDRYGY